MSPARSGTGRDRSGGRGRGADRGADRTTDRGAGRTTDRKGGRGTARTRDDRDRADGPDRPDRARAGWERAGETRRADGRARTADRHDGPDEGREAEEGPDPDRAPGTDPSADREAGPDGVPGSGNDGPKRPARAATAPRTPFQRRRLVAAVVATAVLLGALAAGGWWLLGRFGPEVQEVRVSGVRAISDADVLAAAGVSTGVPLAAVDTGGVEARVSGIPGVAEVDVTRAWPHTLDVAVVERMPVAMADTPDGRQLVDGTGLAYRTPPDPAPRLPMLALPRVVPGDPATTAALAALAAMDPQVRDQVDAVSLGSGGTTLEFALTGNRRVLWGRWADTDAADTPRRAAILGPLLTREGSVYDVSSADLPTVRK